VTTTDAITFPGGPPPPVTLTQFLHMLPWLGPTSLAFGALLWVVLWRTARHKVSTDTPVPTTPESADTPSA